jgi:predicted PurR-regulated permease PerM
MNDVIKSRTLQLYFFGILFLLAGALTVMVLWPFLNSIAIAFVLAVVFKPLYRYFERRQNLRPWLASTLTILLLGIAIILPLSLLFTQILREARDVSVYLVSNDSSVFLNQAATAVEGYVQKIVPDFDLDLEAYTSQLSSGIVRGALENWSVITSGTLSVLHAILSFIIAVVSLYFLFKEGPSLRQNIIRFSPLSEELDRKIMQKLEDTINSVIRGSFVVAIIQGFLAGLGLLFFGVPNPALWGVLAAIGALVPGVGTTVVIIPAVLYLFAVSTPLASLGLLIWGVLVVGLVDNILRPYFYARGIKIHPVLILLSVLGGISVFGPLGFVFGPLVLSLFFTLLDTHHLFVSDEAGHRQDTGK